MEYFMSLDLKHPYIVLIRRRNRRQGRCYPQCLCSAYRYSRYGLSHYHVYGPWWWSSGQRFCLLLRRSEFKSWWRLHKFSVRKDENKWKRGTGWPIFKKKLNQIVYQANFSDQFDTERIKRIFTQDKKWRNFEQMKQSLLDNKTWSLIDLKSFWGFMSGHMSHRWQ